MITVDYILANEDRHLNNFGALRNAETLEWIGMAPIYDSGSSLGYDQLPAQIESDQAILCKPFKNHPEEQVALVSSFDWIDFEALSSVREIITEVFSADGAETYMDERRRAAILASVERRIQRLRQIAQRPRTGAVDSLVDEVRENVAATYGSKG
jgi:hypothetical protein